MANSELLSVIGAGGIASVAYSLISESAKSWFRSLGAGLFGSSNTSVFLFLVLLIFSLPLLILGRIDVVHSFDRNIYVEVNGDLKELSGDGERKKQTFFGLVLSSLKVKIGRYSGAEEYSWLKKKEIKIPFEVSMENDIEFQRIEGQLAYSFFQFYESQYLRDAQSIISAKAEDSSHSKPTDRLSLISQILSLSIVGPDVSNSRKNLLHRFKSEFSNDGWIALLEAADLYADEKYHQAGDLLSIENTHNSKWPGDLARQFFKSVCFLKSSRNVDEPMKSTRLDLALAGFKLVEIDAKLMPVSPYQSHVLASSVIFQGIHHHYKGDTLSAKGEFRRATRFARGSLKARSFNGVGYLEFIQGNLENAEVALLNALESDPNFAYALSNYGYVLMANNNFEKAITYFNRNANSDELRANSYRDVLLAELAVGHANEELTDDDEEIANYYSKVLSSSGRRDFYGIDPIKLRLAYLYNEMAEKIYLSKDYYGLEVFAFALLSKSRFILDNLDKEDPRVLNLSKKVSSTMLRIKPNVPTEWLKDDTDRGAFFSWIKKYQ